MTVYSHIYTVTNTSFAPHLRPLSHLSHIVVPDVALAKAYLVEIGTEYNAKTFFTLNIHKLEHQKSIELEIK